MQGQLLGGAQGQEHHGGAGWAVQGLQRGEGTGARMATLLSPRLLFNLLSPIEKEKGRQEGRDRRKGQKGREMPGLGGQRGVRKTEGRAGGSWQDTVGTAVC